jgi:hypothetical protein
MFGKNILSHKYLLEFHISFFNGNYMIKKYQRNSTEISLHALI